jgi:hypothetical protein
MTIVYRGGILTPLLGEMNRLCSKRQSVSPVELTHSWRTFNCKLADEELAAYVLRRELESGLNGHNQKMTVAARGWRRRQPWTLVVASGDAAPILQAPEPGSMRLRRLVPALVVFEGLKPRFTT